MDLPEVVAVLRALNEELVEYAVFGGVALNLHGLARATEDLDVAVAPTIDNIRRLKRALRKVWDDPSIEQIDEEELCGDYPAVRYIPPSGEFFLDVLTRLGEAFRFESLETELIEVEGLSVRVVTPRQLFAMKRDTVRDRDRMDAMRLAEAFDLDGE